MNYEEAKKLLDAGKKVRLPEWTGYWFAENQDIGKPFELTIKAFTRTGDIVDAWVDKYKDRDDWEEVVSGLGFDFAVIALRAGKKVKRESWKGHCYYCLEEYRSDNIAFYLNGERNYEDEYIISYEEILATDWLLAD
jgi:hypothetical protein